MKFTPGFNAYLDASAEVRELTEGSLEDALLEVTRSGSVITQGLDLSQASLEAALAEMLTCSTVYTLRPTELYVAPEIVRAWRWRPAVRRQGGVRGRRLALLWRSR